MNTEKSSRKTAADEHLERICRRFPELRAVDATWSLASGDGLACTFRALIDRAFRKPTTVPTASVRARRRDELDGLSEAYALD